MLSDNVITADCMALVYIIRNKNPSVINNYGPTIYQDDGLGVFKVVLYPGDYNPVLFLPFIYKNLPVQVV